MAYGTINADVIQSSVTGVSLGAGNATVFKNRIINGDMRIDQRNAGAATANTINDYTLDRWAIYQSVTGKLIVQQNAAAITPPVGFINYLGATSQSAYSVLSGSYYIIRQSIEGLNVSDLGWGTANAKTITISFQVYSSLTGTFGGSLTNNAESRSYPFSYSISVANTWTQISVTIAGDTTGTWLTTNSTGIRLNFGLGVGTTYSGTAGSWSGNAYLSSTGATSVVGTSGATFYITGVQLEVGSSATGFEYVDYGTQLLMCQRYAVLLGDGVSGVGRSTTQFLFTSYLSPPMRTSPSGTIIDTSVTISDNYVQDVTSTGSTLDLVQVSAYGGRISISGFTALTTGKWYGAYNNTTGYVLILSAEL